MEGIIITKFQRDPDGGFWTCRIHNGDATLEAHHQFGSWMTYPDKQGVMQDILEPLKYELVARMRTEEGREKRAQEKLAESNPFVKKATQNGKPKSKEAVAA